MEIRLAYENEFVTDFNSIVQSFKPAEFKSPRRSTVPLLLYWKDYQKKFQEFFKFLNIETPSHLTACFEYKVPVQLGRGKASYTDLMLISDQIVIAIEGKYTEPPYETVKKWLGSPKSENKTKVLKGWIGLIEKALGKSFNYQDFNDLAYQLVHRMASTCYPNADKRFLIYQCFGLENEKKIYYKNQLSNLRKIIGKSHSVEIYLISCPLKKHDEYKKLENLWDLGERDLSKKVKNGILENEMLAFEIPEIIKITSALRKEQDLDKLLSKYELQQINSIKKWKAEEPSVISKSLGVILSPATWLINKIIPEAAIRGALDFSSSTAELLTDTNDIKRDAKVGSIDKLKTKDLELSDKLANAVHNWAIAIASAEGGGTGATGIAGITVDIPAIIILALRTIHKIGVCYGFEVKTKEDKEFILSVLAASGANDMTEKVAALTTLRSVEVTISKTTWKSMTQKAVQKKMSKEAGIIGIRNLGKQLGINLTKRKALQAIPAIGAIVGASVNGWYIKEVGWAARRVFQERWLIENGKIIDI
jgi:hypothetical protein